MVSIETIQNIIDKAGFLLLDGGLATELEHSGFDLQHPLWSANILRTNPEAIKGIHRDYLASGATCIIAASYQASFPGFANQGLFGRDAEALMARAVTLALEARDEHIESLKFADGQQPLIAASIGPYGAYLANGAEYHGKYGVSRDVLHDFHAARLDVLSGAGADLFACETIPDIDEADILNELLRQSPYTAWISFACRDGKHIGDGTPIADCAELFKDTSQVIALGVNCTAPRYITSLIREIVRVAPGKQVVAYPNSGETYDRKLRQWEGKREPETLAKAAIEWYGEGARLLGGCCRTRPSHIAALKAALLEITA